jgi:hypothetical protein
MADDSVFEGAAGQPGPQGPQGPIGPQGIPGEGVPVGGTAGQVLEKIDAVDYNTQWADPSGALPDFNSFENLPVSSTTSDTFALLTRFTTPSLTAGNYIVMWSADSGADSNKEAHHRLQLDDLTTLSQTSWKSDTGLDPETYYAFSGSAFIALSGIHNFDFDGGAQGGDTAYMRNVRLQLWRVS